MSPRPEAAQEEIDSQEWSNPENWRGWLGSYCSTRDSRTWVPKRNPGMGMTLNFAHRGAWWSLLGLMIVPIGMLILLILLVVLPLVR